MFKSRTIFTAAKCSLTGSAILGLGSGLVISHRLALEDYTDVNLNAQYYKTRTTSGLLTSLFVYTISSSPTLVALGKASIRACDAIGMAGVYEVVARKTFFAQFCGGETSSQVQDTMRTLRKDNLGVILAYAREESDSDEFGFERVKQDTLATIDVAATLPNNFVALKLTALANPSSIKAHSAFLRASDSSEQYSLRLNAEDQQQIINLEEKLDCILSSCAAKGVKVLIDAEQDRYQPTIEALTISSSSMYNKQEAIVYGTYQCYLKHTLSRLHADLNQARGQGYKLGVKLVRGAYIASEPRHLIHDTKDDSDKSYDDAIKILLPSSNAETFIATHNAKSIELALSMMPAPSPVAFAQLYGMSSPLTYSLLQKVSEMTQVGTMEQGGGIRVYSYVPWGTVAESMKYLLRRADENSSMIERGKAERDEILTELIRRANFKRLFS